MAPKMGPAITKTSGRSIGRMRIPESIPELARLESLFHGPAQSGKQNTRLA